MLRYAVKREIVGRVIADGSSGELPCPQLSSSARCVQLRAQVLLRESGQPGAGSYGGHSRCSGVAPHVDALNTSGERVKYSAIS